MSQKIIIQLTEEQLEALRPLFLEAQQNPLTGFVLAQLWEDGNATARFTTPERVARGMQKYLTASPASDEAVITRAGV